MTKTFLWIPWRRTNPQHHLKLQNQVLISLFFLVVSGFLKDSLSVFKIPRKDQMGEGSSTLYSPSKYSFPDSVTTPSRNTYDGRWVQQTPTVYQSPSAFFGDPSTFMSPFHFSFQLLLPRTGSLFVLWYPFKSDSNSISKTKEE